MTEITLYNTRTRTKEPFVPIDAANVRMYVCGPTVYDRAHIGNARPVVVFDTLFRLLRHVYGEDHVTYVRNITDVDDKINARAAESGRPIGEITAETARWFHEDMTALGALPPSHEPRATAYVAEMIAMIEALIARGHAYAAEGHVLFAVASYPDYGRFSHRSLDEMQAGARVEVAPYKRDPMDFVLWKPSDAATARLGQPLGPRPPRLAHRMLGDVARPSSAPASTSTAAASTSSSPTTRTRSPSRSAPTPARPSPTSGCTTASSTSRARRCRSRSATSSPSATSSTAASPARSSASCCSRRHYRQPIDWTESKVARGDRPPDAVGEAPARFRRVGLVMPDAAPPRAEVLAALADDLNTPLALKALRDLASEVRRAGRGRTRRSARSRVARPHGHLSRRLPLAAIRAIASTRLRSRRASDFGERVASFFARARRPAPPATSPAPTQSATASSPPGSR